MSSVRYENLSNCGVNHANHRNRLLGFIVMRLLEDISLGLNLVGVGISKFNNAVAHMAIARIDCNPSVTSPFTYFS